VLFRSSAPWPARDVDPPEDLKSSSETTFKIMQAVTLGESKGWIFDRERVNERYNLDLAEGQLNTVAVAPSSPTAPAPTPEVSNA
jgi:hypothetical protein